MDPDATGGALEFDAGAGILVERLAVALQGGIHRWHLLDLAEEGRQRGLDLGTTRRNRAALQNSPLGIGGIGSDTELNRGDIALVGFEQFAGELGGFTETQRQETCG